MVLIECFGVEVGEVLIENADLHLEEETKSIQHI